MPGKYLKREERDVDEPDGGNAASRVRKNERQSEAGDRLWEGG